MVRCGRDDNALAVVRQTAARCFRVHSARFELDGRSVDALDLRDFTDEFAGSVFIRQNRDVIAGTQMNSVHIRLLPGLSIWKERIACQSTTGYRRAAAMVDRSRGCHSWDS